MKISVQVWTILLLVAVDYAGISVWALPYDYSASIECLIEPHKSQYGGGMILNPEFDNGLKGWYTIPDGKIEARTSKAGNRYIVSKSRSQTHHCLSQKLYLQKGLIYTFSAWLQISEGNASVSALFRTASGFTYAGAVIAKSGCWSMLKGGLTVNVTGPAELYFETKEATVEIWVDSVSLQPFTEEQWRDHQERIIGKVHKRRVRFQAVDIQGNTLPGATMSIKQTNSKFPIGCVMNSNILTNTAYQNWFKSRFPVTTFANEMKWYSTENIPGKEDYSVPDAMLAFTQQHGISVRGHNVFWDDPSYQPWWVKSLPQDQLRAAANKRISSIMSRYAGKVIHWDVVNENLHFSFFESNLGQDASAAFYQRAHQLDSNTPMFMNEYNTIEEPRDPTSLPAAYLQKLRGIQAFPGNGGPMGIGLEGHFHTPNLPFIRSSLDTIAGANLPIWITELDIAQDPNQAQYLEQVMREVHAHPAVQGIVIWAGWPAEGCKSMCLTDINFKNLPTGRVVDKLIRKWKSSPLIGITDGNGFFETEVFLGDYSVRISHPSTNSSMVQRLEVAGGGSVHDGTPLTITMSTSFQASEWHKQA